MKSFKSSILHIVGFVLVFLVALVSMDCVFFNEREVHPLWRRIENSDEPVDILVLGNSHAFTSTNAELLSYVWQKDVEVFAHSNQNMCLTLMHLKQALKHQLPDNIFLEVFSPCLDNYHVMQGEKRGTLLQDLDGIRNYAEKAMEAKDLLPWYTVPEGVFQLLRPTNMWSRYNLRYIKSKKTNTTHGYEAAETANSFATGTLEIARIEDDCKSFDEELELAEYNEKALKEFLQITEDKGIKVVMYKAPTTRAGETGLIRSVFRIAEQYDNVVYMNDYRLNLVEMGLNLEDFYDTGHLNKRGGEVFTAYFANDVAEALSLDCDWSKAWGYKSESITELADQTYQYTMESWDPDVVYQFSLYKGKELIDRQAYSSSNMYVSSIDIRQSDEYHLYCSIIPSDRIEEGDACTQRVYTSFMKQNDCVID